MVEKLEEWAIKWPYYLPESFVLTTWTVIYSMEIILPTKSLMY